MDIENKRVKVSKCSITIKDDNNKTCGIVRNISSLYDIQANKQCDIYLKLKKDGIIAMTYGIKDIIISDGNIYFLNDIRKRMHYEKYGFFDDIEKKKYEKREALINSIKEKGYTVIDCIYY